MMLQQWNQASMKLVRKKAHTGNLISTSIWDNNTFFTSSEDNTMRLWDMRMESTVRMFRNESLRDLTNCQNDHENSLFVGSGRIILKFDARQEAIFVEKIDKSSSQAHLDDLSTVKYSLPLKQLAACDDEGDIKIYDTDLQVLALLDQKHSNICNSLDYLYPSNSNPLCVSGGYDCKVLLWDIQQQILLKTVDMREQFKKWKLPLGNSYPFVHHVLCTKDRVLLSMESGHVIALNAIQLNKPMFMLQASLTRIVQAKMCSFKEQIMITLSADGSFSFFDLSKNENSRPVFIEKYKTVEQPNWIDTLERRILVCGDSPELSIYSMKS